MTTDDIAANGAGDKPMYADLPPLEEVQALVERLRECGLIWKDEGLAAADLIEALYARMVQQHSKQAVNEVERCPTCDNSGSINQGWDATRTCPTCFGVTAGKLAPYRQGDPGKHVKAQIPTPEWKALTVAAGQAGLSISLWLRQAIAWRLTALANGRSEPRS